MTVDTDSILTGAFLLGLACLPVAAIVFAGRASRPATDRVPTTKETYPDEHLFI